MDNLKLLLLNQVGNKVIIFSDFSKVFKEISKMLQANNIKYTELDGGNIANIDRDINEYKFGDTRVLMCNSNFFGCGMNLEFTTDIIFLHKMKDDMYNQVIGRAQRPGRTAPLNVFRLLHHNEL
jgi:SNF2 family DNA or RNA helicase